jgi:hypothetical protein
VQPVTVTAVRANTHRAKAISFFIVLTPGLRPPR